jgi:hypothetical protein
LENFQAILLEGLFSVDGIDWSSKPESIDTDSIFCSSGSGKQFIKDALDPLLNQSVQISLHYYPPNGPSGIDLQKWGGGSCMWEPYGWCIAGHHENPHFLLNVSDKGLLTKKDGEYQLKLFNGTTISLPFSKLVGHHSRIVAATHMDVEKMREALSSHDIPDVEAVGAKVEDLKNLLGQLVNTIKDV